jgi:phosphate transport system substrate-binding protein
VQTRRYPLVRATWMVVNRQPDRPLEALVQEFLRYVLSREGQEEVARAGDFLPLSTEVVAEQLRALR